MILLLDIYYDFTCHDLPPAIEDSYEEFWAAGTGYFQAFLAWSPKELKADVRSASFCYLFRSVSPSGMNVARRYDPFTSLQNQDGIARNC